MDLLTFNMHFVERIHIYKVALDRCSAGEHSALDLLM